MSDPVVAQVQAILDRAQRAAEELHDHQRSTAIRGDAISTSMSDMTRDEVDAKIAAAEARGETKFAQMSGKLDMVLSRITDADQRATEHFNKVIEDGRSTRNVIWAALAVAIAVIAIVAGLAPTIFGMGVQYAANHLPSVRP